MSLDTQDSTAGLAFQQVASSSEIGEGTYAIVARGAIDAAAWGAVGTAKLADGDVAGAIDYTPQGDDPIGAGALSGSIDSESGTLSLAGLNARDLTDSESFAYFPIDENRTLAIEISGQQLGLVWLKATDSGDVNGGGGDNDDNQLRRDRLSGPGLEHRLMSARHTSAQSLKRSSGDIMTLLPCDRWRGRLQSAPTRRKEPQ
jgi:hypothetical protein